MNTHQTDFMNYPPATPEHAKRRRSQCIQCFGNTYYSTEREAFISRQEEAHGCTATLYGVLCAKCHRAKMGKQAGRSRG